MSIRLPRAKPGLVFQGDGAYEEDACNAPGLKGEIDELIVVLDWVCRTPADDVVRLLKGREFRQIAPLCGYSSGILRAKHVDASSHLLKGDEFGRDD